MKKRLSVLAVPAILAVSACNHVTTRVPGVVDMRTDGKDAPVETAASKVTPRSGFDGIMQGAGVQSTGSVVTVEDRKLWILRIIAISNESATEEINEAIGKGGAIRDVSVGDSFTGMDWLIGFGAGLIPCVGVVAPFIIPPFTATMSGTRIKPVSGEPAFDGAPSALAPDAGAPPTTPAGSM